MLNITETDIFELQSELSNINVVLEAGIVSDVYNTFKDFFRMSPERFGVHFDKLVAIANRMRPASQKGSDIIKKKFYIDQCKDYIQSVTYLSEHEINQTIESVTHIIKTYQPSGSEIEKIKLIPYAWALTTISLETYRLKDPSKKLSWKEVVSLVNNKCKEIKEKLFSTSNKGVRYGFFIFLTMLLFNSLYYLTYDKTPEHALSFAAAVNLTFILSYYFSDFVFSELKKTTVKESVEFKRPVEQIESFIKEYGKKFTDADYFVDNSNILYSKLKKIVPKVPDIKALLSRLIDNILILLREESDMTDREASSLSKQIVKHIMATFDIAHRTTILLPISWIFIAMIIVEWKKNHPADKITKEVILNSSKEYFYKQSLRWAKHKAKTKQQKLQGLLLVPFLLYGILYFDIFRQITALTNISLKERGITNLRFIYTVSVLVYLFNSLGDSIRAAKEGDI